MAWQLAWVSIAQALPEVLNMIIPPEDIEAAALQLTQAERAKLAERLLVSLDEDDEILAAWVEEAERRAMRMSAVKWVPSISTNRLPASKPSSLPPHETDRPQCRASRT
jgi:hypothetical protein